MSMTKDDRLQIRVGPAEKGLLERAAAATHVSVSAFVVQSAAARLGLDLLRDAVARRDPRSPASVDALVHLAEWVPG
jgi:uncharacterized protein (DUF1778 family)